MSTIMRAGALAAALLLPIAAGCGDDDDEPASQRDAGPSSHHDAGTAAPASKLPRVSLPRPPKNGLPAELRPPR